MKHSCVSMQQYYTNLNLPTMSFKRMNEMNKKKTKGLTAALQLNNE